MSIRYENTPILKTKNDNFRNKGIRYYKNLLYPEIPLNENDYYVITEFGDRLDLLANQFYNDSTLYWIIAISNPDVLNLGSLHPIPGTQLRIPFDINLVIEKFNSLNNL